MAAPKSAILLLNTVNEFPPKDIWPLFPEYIFPPYCKSLSLEDIANVIIKCYF